MDTIITLTRMHLLTMLLAVALSTMIAVTLLTAASLGRIAVCESIATTAHKYVEEHGREADEWKKRIIHLEAQIKDIKTKPLNRPDAFTGKMGSELRSYAQSLEQRILAIETTVRKLDSAIARGSTRSPREEL